MNGRNSTWPSSLVTTGNVDYFFLDQSLYNLISSCYDRVILSVKASTLNICLLSRKGVVVICKNPNSMKCMAYLMR